MAKKNLAQDFIDRTKRVVNSIEDEVDATWKEYESVLKQHTKRAHAAITQLISALPAHPDPAKAKLGYIDFQSRPGQRARIAFFRNVAKVYANWESNVLGDLDIMKWDRGTPSWEKSLGLVPHRGGHFLMRIRHKVLTKAQEIGSMLHGAELGESIEEVKRNGLIVIGKITVAKGGASKGFSGPTTTVKTGGVLSKAPLALKASPALSKRAGKAILAGAKDAISDQEKGWLENVLRGMDQLARNNANQIYDVATGNALRKELEKAADKFSATEMNTKQLMLSVQTHIRAMIRRIVLAPQYQKQVGKFYIQIPATRIGDAKTPTTKERAFTITDATNIISDADGSGDSLGMYPGDQVQSIPLPGEMDDIAKAAEEERKKYLEDE